jgi:hypothetical protein
MLLHISDHRKLFQIPWTLCRDDNKTYYIKYLFEEKQYFMLVTDLCLVWYEHGNYKRIQQNAALPNVDIESEQEAMAILVRVKKTFLGNIARCSMKKEPGLLKVSCKPQYPRTQPSDMQINDISWVFNCDLLDQDTTSAEYLSGPRVIFENFIMPSQSIVNYFAENLSGTFFFSLLLLR